ncbi:MAG: RNA polymerase sigma factor [Blautia wexlerae]
MKYEEFERIYQEYYLKILTFIHKRVPDLYEAEELTGDVFLSFYRNMDSYDEEKGSIATWLYAITANRLKNYYRDKKDSLFSGNPEAADNSPEKMPEEIVAKIMREETLRKSLEQLSDREREILLGRFYYQKSSTELGRQMNLSPGNVRMIQKRALEKLRMIMEKQGE